MPDGLLLPMIVAASSLPAFLAARAFGADRPRLARLMRLVGVAILAGAVGLAWAGGDRGRVVAVAVVLALAVNGLGLAVLVDALRSRRGGGRH
ncbi:hypothetical protein QFW77_14060 [Luteimonas sp. RD2P54]|uniref:Uncharacterized protein n=1 Tax=Luteimonas endophytica TaxID=3042023 RepID=A0ABT6JBA2_9GAMM|nr:hypothetical protein [Luteimonas endophytica]MDH5824102.1 hypothetical protein [Luteimonas endophytica]